MTQAALLRVVDEVRGYGVLVRERDEVGVHCTGPDGNSDDWARFTVMKVVRSGQIPSMLEFSL